MGSMSTTQNLVIITLLEKSNKDIRFVENWRPISLINVDVKVCSKALSNRIIDLLPKLIHPNQAAFVKGRNIDDPLRFLADLFDYVENNEDKSYILFAADFQKAFDSIEHNFMFAVLRHFGFGENFIQWIKIMLKNSKSCVLNNGNVSDFFELKRGTKQGDPISPSLFILTIEIMAELIRSNKEIRGLQVDKEMDTNKLVLFADDATFCVKDVESLEKILESLELFKTYSSLQLNFEKSEVGWIGDAKDEKLLGTIIKKKINFQISGVKILGIYFSHNQEYTRINNLERIFENFKSILSMWKMRNLTLYGKSQVVRSLAISQLLFVCSKISVPHSFIKKVEKEITKFLWNEKKPKVKYKTLIADYNEGGIRLPDFESIIQANRAGWALKLTMDSKERSYWKYFAQILFKSFGGLDILGENFDPSYILKSNKFPVFYK
ncbi:MAG: hypothetical protein DSY43_01870 [Gammaproteobacteria bacterium]|nr:MAG: hypothetical protein DSY43_01870 [Gammaproteobacteria bacterium]